MLKSPDFNVGLSRLVGLELLDLTADSGRAQIDVDQRHLQPWGLVHGGLHCTVVEMLASLCGYHWLRAQGGDTCVGVNNTTDFLRPVSAGLLTAVATPVHRGRRQQLWAVVITDSFDRTVARGQVRLHNIWSSGEAA